MIGYWDLKEARFLQFAYEVSPADATDITLGSHICPPEKARIFLNVGYMPTAAETRVIAFSKMTKFGQELPLINPFSAALNPALATFLEQGNEEIFFPGEYLIVRRDDHTAGSQMKLWAQFVEIDLPLYTYEEPQRVRRAALALSSVRQAMGIVGGSRGGGAPVAGPVSGGGGRRSLPK